MKDGRKYDVYWCDIMDNWLYRLLFSGAMPAMSKGVYLNRVKWIYLLIFASLVGLSLYFLLKD